MFQLFSFSTLKIKYLLVLIHSLLVVIFLAAPFILKLFIDDLQYN